MPPGSQRIALTVIALGLMTALTSCDRPPPPAPVQAKLETVEIKTVSQLLPTRPTHLAVTPRGVLYWVQESEAGSDLAFVAGDGVVPRATRLSTIDILAAMETRGGKGNIQSIASGPAGEIYFYFVGAFQRWPRVCFGRYFPATGQIQLLADTAALADATGMGRSLDLARGEIIVSKQRIWLFIRHTDTWALFGFDPAAVPTTGLMTLRRAFSEARIDNIPVDLTRESITLSAAGGDALFLSDSANGELATLDSTGNGATLTSMVGLPKLFTPPIPAPSKPNAAPSSQPAGPTPMIIFARADPIHSKTDAFPDAPVQTSFPALLVFRGTTIESLGGDQLLTPSGFPGYAMNLQTLCEEPEGSWVGYDAASGQVLRVKMTNSQ